MIITELATKISFYHEDLVNLNTFIESLERNGGMPITMAESNLEMYQINNLRKMNAIFVAGRKETAVCLTVNQEIVTARVEGEVKELTKDEWNDLPYQARRRDAIIKVEYRDVTKTLPSILNLYSTKYETIYAYMEELHEEVNNRLASLLSKAENEIHGK